jgi:hypothetical protein
MAPEPGTDPKHIWQTQPTEAESMSLDDIRAKAVRFQKTIKRRNWREYAAIVLVIYMFGQHLWTHPTPISRLGNVLVILGSLFVGYQLHRRGTAGDISPALPGPDYMAAYRSEMLRQRDLLQSVLTWYLLPLVPGMVVLGISRAVEFHPVHWANLIIGIGVATLIFAGVWYINILAARRLQARIDEIDAMLQSYA